MAAPSRDAGEEAEAADVRVSSPLAHQSSLPSPRPKSPPEYPDLYGKRREAARVQIIEREIGFLEGEIKFTESVQPASKCCKEVSDFVVANPDPLIPARRKSRRSCWFWKWLCGPCLGVVSFCCCCQSKCSCHLKKPKCCNCTTCSCIGSKCCDESHCSISSCCPSCSCFRGCCCSCPDMSCCIPTCCTRPSCLTKKKSSCCTCNCKIRWSSCLRCCPKVKLCSCCFCNCKNLCSNPCCLGF